MTVIAYRDGVLAADTLVMRSSGGRVGFMEKIYRAANGNMLSISGDVGAVAAMIDWFLGSSGENPEAYQSAIKSEDDGSVALYRKDKDPLIWEGEHCFHYSAPYYAFGGGASVARGAMFVGAGPERAVEAAIASDITCGGKITVLRH